MNPRFWTRACIACVMALLFLSATGCICLGEQAQLVDLRTETQTVELGGASRVEVIIDEAIGDCTITSGSQALMEAKFVYNVEEWKPLVEYQVVDGKGVLKITQPDAHGKRAPNKATNEWSIILGEDIPLSLSVDLGIGEADLSLGDLRLTGLDVEKGVGEVSVNLSGGGIGDLDASIDGGVGEIRLTVPTSTGVRVKANTGVGSLRSVGLTKSDGYLINDAYGKTAASIEVKVDSGVGSVTIESLDAGSASM